MKVGRKTTGGKYKRTKKRKLSGRLKESRIVKLGETKTKILKGRGGNEKIVSLTNNYVNVTNKKTTKRVKIKNVIETPSNTFLARQNVLVKGAIIDTELGKAKITNRPSQEGIVQAVIIS